MPPAARITDMHVCPMVTVLVPHVGGPILPPGCPTVLIGGLPAARATDMATCVGPPDVIIMGSPTVLIGNLMAARIGDPTAHGGVIVLGCFTVMIGEVGMGSPGAPGVAALPTLTQRNAELEAKKLRLRNRAALVAKARLTAPSLPPDQQTAVLATAERFERDTAAVERARLAADVYPNPDGKQGDPPIGWTRVSDDPVEMDKLGLSASDFRPKGSGFRAALYKSEIDGRYVIAFKGTSSLEDWMNNVRQAMGANSDYYTRAIQLVKSTSDATDGNLEVTGHSLGGGMCTAAGITSNIPCTAFNPAGVHPNTLARYGKLRQEDSKVDTYQVEDEVLSNAQGDGAILPDAVGRLHKLPAVDEQGREPNVLEEVISAVFPLYGLYESVGRHSMKSVINGLEKQKSDDQATMMSILDVGR